MPLGRRSLPSVRSAEERNALVEQHIRLADWFLNSFRSRWPYLAWLLRSPPDYDDALQAARMGLIRAAELYNPNSGRRFGTYAVHWIKQAVLSWAENRGIVHVPRYVQKGRPGRLKNWDDIRAKGKAAGRVLSLDSPGAALGPGTDRPDFGPDAELEALLKNAWESLADEERDLLRLRFWHGHTLKEIGRHMHLTRERIRQKQNELLAKLREKMGVAI